VVGFSVIEFPVQKKGAQFLCSLPGPLRVGVKIEIHLYGMSTSNAVIDPGTVEDALIVGDNKPDIGAAIILAERERREQLGGWLLG
jgi:hypothetical protein